MWKLFLSTILIFNMGCDLEMLKELDDSDSTIPCDCKPLSDSQQETVRVTSLVMSSFYDGLIKAYNQSSVNQDILNSDPTTSEELSDYIAAKLSSSECSISPAGFVIGEDAYVINNVFIQAGINVIGENCPLESVNIVEATTFNNTNTKFYIDGTYLVRDEDLKRILGFESMVIDATFNQIQNTLLNGFAEVSVAKSYKMDITEPGGGSYVISQKSNYYESSKGSNDENTLEYVIEKSVQLNIKLDGISAVINQLYGVEFSQIEQSARENVLYYVNGKRIGKSEFPLSFGTNLLN
ncbi:MAG: hypothetical protein AB8E15_13590 [Bdellovibrionales bacterium]